MADKHLAYDTRKNTDLFSDDDPLAELARIVGFEPRVAANTVADAPKQEPAFDLEDELLREFERYDAPRPVEVVHAPVQAAAPAETSAAQVEHLPPAADVNQQSPERDSVPTEQVVPSVAEEAHVEAPVYRGPHEPAAYSTAPASHSSGARDLIEELEMSIGGAAAAAPAANQKAPQWSAATIRLPLANFNRASGVPVEPSVRQETQPVRSPAPDSTSTEPTPPPVTQSHAEVDTQRAIEAQPKTDGVATAASFVPVAEIHSPEPVVDRFDFSDHIGGDVRKEPVAADAGSAFSFDIDDLLNDVSKFPVSRRSSGQGESEVPVNLADEIASPVAAFPIPATSRGVSTAAPKAEPVSDDPFSGHDFELDLEGIELELADLDFADPAPAAPTVAPAPVREAPVAAKPQVAPAAPQQIDRNQADYVSPKPEPDFAEDDLPFDPSMIGDADHHPEAVEMHVPTLPPVEQHEPVPVANDFDFDVDSEIASLLAATPVKEKTPVQQGVAPDWLKKDAPSQVKPKVQETAAGYDDFEKALEEDFRRSVAEPVRRNENVSHLQIESASHAEDKHRARSMKRMLAAAASIVMIGGIAYGGYSFLAKGSLGLGGEPKVILADKDPVKVVPDNPGGKTVPNQDKAVYDSVGGAAAPAPKQKALVTSDEQPVDVVQKTLTPEVSPEDDSGDGASGTPVGDTEDPRLLPSQVSQGGPAAQADRSSSMAARKVRTMIVKPDGTLVPRDDSSSADDAPPVRAVQSQRVGQVPQAASGGTTEVASNGGAMAPANQPVGLAPQTPSESPLAKVAAADPANVSPPLNRVQSAPVKDAAPTPSTRPVAPAAKPAQPAKEVAAAAPTVAHAPAAASAASGGYGVQIASLPSEDEAKRSYANLSNKFGSVIAGKPYEIRKVDIAGKGTYYRLRIQANSKDEAADICVKYRAAGGTCLISK
ncbi:SPOR domain-containing protein [Oryzifoliimicrobium ureilyticus]|uniref:SPOR domain-containing protein n=1 Tax=Oryzifoliimicrobium ureilyticus TaxID=3113724 RepID=UPI00307643E1